MLRGRLKHIVIQHLTRNLLKTITVEDLFRKEGQVWYIGRRKIADQELEALKEEAEQLLKSEIWRLMTKEIRWRAGIQMLEKAVTPEDMTFGKATLYTWDLAKKFLETVRSL